MRPQGKPNQFHLNLVSNFGTLLVLPAPLYLFLSIPEKSEGPGNVTVESLPEIGEYFPRAVKAQSFGSLDLNLQIKNRIWKANAFCKNKNNNNNFIYFNLLIYVYIT